MKKRVQTALLAAIYPNRCIFCNALVAYDAFCCADCQGKLVEYGEKPSLYETKRIQHVDVLRSVYRYDNTARSAVFRLKFYGDYSVVRAMAACMAQAVRSYLFAHPDYPEPELVIPVPMYPSQEYKRGCNQSVLLAKQIAGELGCPYAGRLLYKIKKTRKQHDISYRDRQNNLQDAFYAPKPKALHQKSVLLVDDISTSGNTFAECAKILKDAGADRVFCLSFLSKPQRHRASYHLKEWEAGRYQVTKNV